MISFAFWKSYCISAYYDLEGVGNMDYLCYQDIFSRLEKW